MNQFRLKRVALLLALLVMPQHASAQSGRIYRPEDRILITDFRDVTSVARDQSNVYGITRNGIVVYDFIARRFHPPITVEDGYPVRELPLAAAYAASSFQLVIGTAAGGVFTYNTATLRLEQVSHIGAPITGMYAPESGYDVFAGTSQGWFRLRGGSYIAEPVARPPLIAPPGANDPFLRTALGTAGSEPGRATAAVSSIVANRNDGSWYVGTRGNGIVHIDTRTMTHDRLRFGLTTRGAGAVALFHDRLFFGGDARAVDGSLVSASQSLDEFEEYPPSTGAPQSAITALLAADTALWVGTSDGLYVLRGRPRAERWTRLDRAVPGVITALYMAGSDILVATDRGVTRVAPGDVVTDVLTGRPVQGIAVSRDTLWAACDVGLAVIPLTPGAAPSGLTGSGAPLGQAYDVRFVGDTLYAVTRDALYRRGPSGWVEPDRTPAARLGPLGRIRSDGAEVWLLGTLGMAGMDAKTGLWTYYMAADDIAEAPVRDLVPIGATLWLASPAGAMRIPKNR